MGQRQWENLKYISLIPHILFSLHLFLNQLDEKARLEGPPDLLIQWVSGKRRREKGNQGNAIEILPMTGEGEESFSWA
jgi:hypothetical protein